MDFAENQESIIEQLNKLSELMPSMPQIPVKNLDNFHLKMSKQEKIINRNQRLYHHSEQKEVSLPDVSAMSTSLDSI